MFCKIAGNDEFTAQLPVSGTLGQQFYVPPLSNVNLDNAHIIVTASEDSTVTVVKGDYDNLDIILMKGQHIERPFVDNKVRGQYVKKAFR